MGHKGMMLMDCHHHVQVLKPADGYHAHLLSIRGDICGGRAGNACIVDQIVLRIVTQGTEGQCASRS